MNFNLKTIAYLIVLSSTVSAMEPAIPADTPVRAMASSGPANRTRDFSRHVAILANMTNADKYGIFTQVKEVRDRIEKANAGLASIEELEADLDSALQEMELIKAVVPSQTYVKATNPKGEFRYGYILSMELSSAISGPLEGFARIPTIRARVEELNNNLIRNPDKADQIRAALIADIQNVHACMERLGITDNVVGYNACML